MANRLLPVVLLLAACGGLSRYSQEVDGNGSSGAGTGGSAGAGTGGSAGERAGAGGAAAGVAGRAATGGAGERWGPGNVTCWNYEDMSNEPKPGATGIDACPAFNDIDFTYPGHEKCEFVAVQNESVAPVPGWQKGDCCYALSSVACL